LYTTAFGLASASGVCDDVQAADGLFGIVARYHEFAALGLAARGVADHGAQARADRQRCRERVVDELEVLSRSFELHAGDMQHALADVAHGDRLFR